jgi:PTH1 family peptidyl-tRNA hydrolase
MKIIVWLGNPWKQYEKTRHNVWFMFLDYLQDKNNFEDFRYESKFSWEISSWKIWWEKIILLKPQTFMNLSWESLLKIIQFYKLSNKDFLVIYDDKDIDFWKIRFREKWRAWGHNWIKNIIKFFKEDFDRIKIWVWYDNKYDVSDWVLSKFQEEELIDLENKIFPNIEKNLKQKIS